jgi:hypothetical protein
MSYRPLIVATVGLGLAVSAPQALAQDQPPAMETMAAADIAWENIEVPGFRPGMQIAVLHGDFTVPDEPYALRLMLPEGYRFPPHWHPRAENVTVLEGTFLLKMGREFDESKLEEYAPGDYMYIRPENPHFGGAKSRVVLQLHGTGPFEIRVVEGQGMAAK